MSSASGTYQLHQKTVCQQGTQLLASSPSCLCSLPDSSKEQLHAIREASSELCEAMMQQRFPVAGKLVSLNDDNILQAERLRCSIQGMSSSTMQQYTSTIAQTLAAQCMNECPCSSRCCSTARASRFFSLSTRDMAAPALFRRTAICSCCTSTSICRTQHSSSK
jgi:hypothetical protein